MEAQITLLRADLTFPESPRWHEGHVWCSDDHRVLRVSPAGEVQVMARLDSHVLGIQCHDGALFAAIAHQRRIVRIDAQRQVTDHADLSPLFDRPMNEFVFGPGGDIYAGHMGFDIRQGEPPRPARMARIRPDGHMALTGPELWFANGMALSVEGDALIVAESMAQRITRIPILPDGELGEAEIFADLSERGDHPDGLCVAADGSVWYAAHAHLTRVARGGAVLSRIALPFAFATSCVLGKGGDLYVTALRHRPGPDAPPQADAVLARVALPAHS